MWYHSWGQVTPVLRFDGREPFTQLFELALDVLVGFFRRIPLGLEGVQLLDAGWRGFRFHLPHGATADFDLVHLRQGQETRRERWSITLRFTFLTVIPSELVVYNPMGILITYLQTDQALVTEQPR